MIKLNTGPAATTLMRAQTDFFEKNGHHYSDCPPLHHTGAAKGQQLNGIFCLSLVKPTMASPSPSENSFTRIPLAFARRKCPSSWNRIIALNSKIAMIYFMITLPPAFYPFIYRCLRCQNLVYRRMFDICNFLHCRCDNIRISKKCDSAFQKHCHCFLVGCIKYRRDIAAPHCSKANFSPRKVSISGASNVICPSL